MDPVPLPFHPQQSQAEAELRQAGLAVTVEPVDSTEPAGQVVAQSPDYDTGVEASKLMEPAEVLQAAQRAKQDLSSRESRSHGTARGQGERRAAAICSGRAGKALRSQ